jgi:AcrR family transcriptional regulator
MTQIRESSECRQRQIVEAARKIIATRGMEALTIREIAKEVGISDGDIYRHFASKKDILLLLIEDIERTLLEAVDQAASDKQDPIEGLENVLKAHLSYLEQRRGVSLLVIAETLRLGDKDLRKRMFEVVNRYMGRIEELLASGVKSGQVSKSLDLGTAALTFFALVHATVTLWALSNAGFSLAKRHKPLWKSYLAGIAIGGPEGG